MHNRSLYLIIIVSLLPTLFTSCSFIKTKTESSFSYYFNIQKTCYVYIDEEPFRNHPFQNANPHSRTESSYFIKFNPHELTVSVVRQNIENKINDVPEKLNKLKNIIVKSDLLRRSDLEKIEYAKFKFQNANKSDLSIIDLKPEKGRVIEESNLIKEMKYIITSLYSRDAGDIKFLYPLEQSNIDGEASYVFNITLRFYGYDIKVPIIVSHNTENSYNVISDRNEKIFHRINSLSLQEMKVSNASWDIKFGVKVRYLLFELYEP